MYVGMYVCVHVGRLYMHVSMSVCTCRYVCNMSMYACTACVRMSKCVCSCIHILYAYVCICMSYVYVLLYCIICVQVWMPECTYICLCILLSTYKPTHSTINTSILSVHPFDRYKSINSSIYEPICPSVGEVMHGNAPLNNIINSLQLLKFHHADLSLLRKTDIVSCSQNFLFDRMSLTSTEKTYEKEWGVHCRKAY
jgi:hypothetical protein